MRDRGGGWECIPKITWAFMFAKIFAVASPMPPLAPVTIATLLMRSAVSLQGLPISFFLCVNYCHNNSHISYLDFS
jgi:hypothetical protein